VTEVALATEPSGRTRLCRWLGLDRNPLRRTSDRIEAWVTLLVMAAFLPLAVLATCTAVRWVHQADKRDQADRQVSATALAPARVPFSNYGMPETMWVPATWVVGHRRYTAQAQVPYGTAKGAEVRIWLDPRGRPIGVPTTASQALIQVVAAGVMTPLIVAEILTLFWAALRWLMDRRHLAAWGAEWQSFDPQQARP
jgi:hypothetical protein